MGYVNLKDGRRVYELEPGDSLRIVYDGDKPKQYVERKDGTRVTSLCADPARVATWREDKLIASKPRKKQAAKKRAAKKTARGGK